MSRCSFRFRTSVDNKENTKSANSTPEISGISFKVGNCSRVKSRTNLKVHIIENKKAKLCEKFSEIRKMLEDLQVQNGNSQKFMSDFKNNLVNTHHKDIILKD